MKITIIGGGSFSWTHFLVGDFLLNNFFDGAELCLMDINEQALKEVLVHCEMLNKLSNINIRFSTTTDLTEGIRGASYVITAVAIGGMDATIQDHEIGRSYGFRNIKGHDIGVAGFSRTLRHVPFLVRLAGLMEKFAEPGAMLLNVTNPLVANTMAVYSNTTVKAYGFCHGVYNHLEVLLPLFDAESMDEIEYVTTGVDHCSWLLDVKVNGKDALEIMRNKGIIESAYRNETVIAADDPFAGKEMERLRFVIWDQLGYFPAISDDHICEFFPNFLKSEKVRNFWKITYDRIVARKATIAAAHQKHQDIIDKKVKPSLKASGEIIARTIAALHGCGSFVSVMNAPNVGQISNLPKNMLVETKCLIGANGIQPVTTGSLPDILESIVCPVALHEKLYMEAAYNWDKQKAVAALSTDPIVGDFINVKELVDKCFSLNEKVLRNAGIPIGSWQN